MAASLETIRALSQYRPFEGGGQSVRDAHADIVLAALAEAGGHLSTIEELREAVRTLFRLDLGDLSLAAALNQLAEEGRVTGHFDLTEIESDRLRAVAAESDAIAAQALADWRVYLTSTWTLEQAQIESLIRDLATYLRTVLRRHGAEASLLLYPESEPCQALYRALEDEGFDFLPASDVQEIRDDALSQFIRHPTPSQRDYLAQNLNTAYFLTVLSIDPDGARLVQEIASGQRVYLDTNFLYRLLGVRGPADVAPAEAILRTTQQAGYVVAVTPWTLHEFRESLSRARDFLDRYPIPASEYAEVAAAASPGENFITAYWRRVRSGVKVRDFYEYYAEVETHLANHHIEQIEDGCAAIDAQTAEVTDQMAILARVSHGRYRHPATLEHDVKHRMLVKRLRGTSHRNFSSAGFWFLTHDSVLPRYDYAADEDEAGHLRTPLAFCVSAGSWYQVMEAFRPKTEDPEQSLADMLASPYVRYRRPISQARILEIVARVEQYKDGSPELATRVLMNSAGLDEIDRAPDEERVRVIDNEIVAAARQAQEDARQARAIAEEERDRAAAATEELQRRAAAADRRAEEAIALARAEQRAELAAAEQRQEQALAAAAERQAQALAAAEQRHTTELRDRETELSAARTSAEKARRRYILLVAFLLSVGAFFLLDLAVGLATAWSAVVALSVLAGLWLALSDWAKRRSQRS